MDETEDISFLNTIELDFGDEVDDSFEISGLDREIEIDAESDANKSPNEPIQSSDKDPTVHQESLPDSRDSASCIEETNSNTPKQDDDPPLILQALNTFYDPANSILRHKTNYKPLYEIFRDRFGSSSGLPKNKCDSGSTFSLEGLKKVLPLVDIAERREIEEHKYYRVLSDELWEYKNENSDDIHSSEINSQKPISNPYKNSDHNNPENDASMLSLDSEDNTDSFADSYLQTTAEFSQNSDESCDIEQTFEPRMRSTLFTPVNLSLNDGAFSTEEPANFYKKNRDDELDSSDEEAKEPRFLRTVVEQSQQSRLVIKDKLSSKETIGTNDILKRTTAEVIDKGKIVDIVATNQAICVEDWNEDYLDFEPFSP